MYSTQPVFGVFKTPYVFYMTYFLVYVGHLCILHGLFFSVFRTAMYFTRPVFGVCSTSMYSALPVFGVCRAPMYSTQSVFGVCRTSMYSTQPVFWCM